VKVWLYSMPATMASQTSFPLYRRYFTPLLFQPKLFGSKPKFRRWLEQVGVVLVASPWECLLRGMLIKIWQVLWWSLPSPSPLKSPQNLNSLGRGSVLDIKKNNLIFRKKWKKWGLNELNIVPNMLSELTRIIPTNPKNYSSPSISKCVAYSF
jgi:hypothetical protein